MLVQYLKNTASPEEYNHSVACFLEKMITNRVGISSMKIISLCKEIFRHHKDVLRLKDTVDNFDISPMTELEIQQLMEKYTPEAVRFYLEATEKMPILRGEFIEMLRDYIADLLGTTTSTFKKLLSNNSLFGKMDKQKMTVALGA